MAKPLITSLCNTSSQNALYITADNQYGLGDNNSSAYTYSFSQQVGSSSDWADVSAKYDHSLAVKTDGTLWAWGFNTSGQLGLNDTVYRSSPTQIGTSTDWSKVFAGQESSFAIKTNGTLWSWGSNSYGFLALGDVSSRSSPVQVGTDTNWSSISYNASSLGTVQAIKTDGTLWSWGSNFTSGSTPEQYLGTATPTTSPTLINSDNWSELAFLGSTCHGIKSDGTLWAWGLNANGQFGNNSTTNSSSPIQIGISTNWSKVSSGNGFTSFIKTDGTLWSCGASSNGNLGQNDIIARSSPIQIGTDTNWSFISTSNGSLAIKTSGALYAWGSNSSGALGLGDIVNRSSPVQVGLLTDWKTVKIGFGNHSLAIKTDGTLWSWGSNTSGQLGSNSVIARSSPVQVGLLTNWSVCTIGSDSSLAIKTDGTLWSWGSNSNGQLGQNDSIQRSSPVQVGLLTNWKFINASYLGTILAIKTDGTLWGWGNNSTFQLGLGDYNNRSSPVQIGNSTSWQTAAIGSYGSIGSNQNAGNNNLYFFGGNYYGSAGTGVTPARSSPVQIGTDTNWSKLSSSANATFIKKTNGTLWTFGIAYTKLGLGQNSVGFNYPVQIGSNTDWDTMASGSTDTLAIKTDGTLWGWGDNSSGTLGRNNVTQTLTPTKIGLDTDWKNVYIASSVALLTRGTNINKKLYASGGLSVFGLDNINRSSPVLIESTGDWNVLTGLNSGGTTSTAELSISNYILGINSNKLFCSGISMRGGLGANIILNYKTFAPSGFKVKIKNYSYIYHLLYIDSNNRLWSFGYNFYGQLGQNNAINRSSPVQIGTDANWKTQNVSGSSSFAIKTDGTLWSWGSNGRGELGQNISTVINRSSPVQVGLLTDWDKVYGSTSSCYAIKTDGTLWGWGYNAQGQLGLGDVIDRSSPVQIGLLTNWSSIATSNSTTTYALGLKTDGTLWSWGYNGNGNLGLGDLVYRSSPVQIGLSTDWKYISVGSNGSSFAIKTNGTLWAWGENNSGQLGTNNIISRSSPVQVGTDTNWQYIIAGYYFTFAVKTDGTIYSWGKNDDFQLGTGTKVSRSSPVQVSSLSNWILPNNSGFRNFITFKV